MPADSPSPERQLWLIAREGEAGTHLVADVALRLRSPTLYTYAVPETLREQVQPGVLVQVPYGRSGADREGLCIGVSVRPWDHTRRPIAAVLTEPLGSPAVIQLGMWVSEYYFCPPWRTFAAILPTFLRSPRTVRVRYVRRTSCEPAAPPRGQAAAVLAALEAGELPRGVLLERAGAGVGVLRRLVEAGLIQIDVRREPAPESLDEAAELAFRPSAEDEYALTVGQSTALAAVLEQVASGQFHALLLFGQPGSGKTEVYVRAIRQTVVAGRQAILLVPEIALTTQIVERLARRFQRVAVLHSQLSDRQRAANWQRIARGAVDVVIGTRSAVFAPCPRLGLIVVDEEQESSFKNLAAPYYHARDVAIKRGQLEGATVLLGSATPSLETWYNASQNPRFGRLELPERVGGSGWPTILPVPTHGAGPLLSEPLRAQLRDVLAAGHQAILLHNRRGYALRLRCPRCGLGVRCPRCDGHMVFHRGEQVVKCHRCGQRQAAPRNCPDASCAGPLEPVGVAIQKLAEELTVEFPAARVLRLDRDTMRRREDYAAALHRFESGAADVLLGTQMVAKGLDFPAVRLVGVIDAAARLLLPDFRAAEQAFALLMQVIGRAGRRSGHSCAVVQSDDFVSPAVRDALRMDYPAFAAAELRLRERHAYPPFVRLARLVLADARPNRARRCAAELAGDLRRVAGRVHAGLRIDEAEPCVVARVRDVFRYQVLVRAPREVGVQPLFQAAAGEKLLTPAVQRFTIDVDPLDLL